MSALKIQRPDYTKFIHLKQAGFSIAGYRTRNLEGLLSTLDWHEIKEEFKKLKPEYYLPSFKEVTEAFEALVNYYPNYQKIAVDMLGIQERTDDIICWPDKNWFYARIIEPRIQRGEHPVLIQKADSERRGNKNIIKGGERIEIPYFPKTSGKMTVNIKELGLSKGIHVFSSSDYGEHEGIRNLICGNMSINPKNRILISSVSPQFKNEKIGFRLFTKRTSESNLEDYLKEF